MKKISLILIVIVVSISCATNSESTGSELPSVSKRIADYKTVKLTTDLSVLSENEKQIIPLMIEVADIMDEIYWIQTYGDKNELLASVEDPTIRQFVEINYGPWDRLNGNEPFVRGAGNKPPGANFYPADMTREEFEASDLADKNSLYTIIRRNEAGELVAIPYKQMFPERIKKAEKLLRQCAELAEDEGLKAYLTIRADALITDVYQPSDLTWMDMKNNTLEFIVGPIETYEDGLFGYKAAHEAYVLVKDKEWSTRLAVYADYLEELQQGLPVSDEYKKEKPGKDADLNAYDVIYYAGDCNTGSKTIAINLPNDEEVQLSKGSRRLQLKNTMRSKFDHILTPVSDVLIHEDQRKYVTFDSFFENVMFHEVAHGLGIKKTINGKGTVREALKEYASALEEGKADVLGLYMIQQLYDKGVIEGDIMENYVTFLASIFRSVRFGVASSHGKATMIRFNYYKDQGAFAKDEATGTYKVDMEKMREATNMLSQRMLTLQGDGDYDGVAELFASMGNIDDALQMELDRLKEQSIPVDLIFEQGTEVLGL